MGGNICKVFAPRSVWNEAVTARPAARGVLELRGASWLSVSDAVETSGLDPSLAAALDEGEAAVCPRSADEVAAGVRNRPGPRSVTQLVETHSLGDSRWPPQDQAPRVAIVPIEVDGRK